ncbi:sigma 54-interacting transcriptional regulator [bacterium]|nr:sigma 54-interacting transcriptional regulator [bacterium]
MREKIQQWSLCGLDGAPSERPINIKAGKTTIGRGEENELRLSDKSVSREHAVIECTDGGLVIHDQNSANGVYVNKIPRKTAHLQPGDQLTIGDFLFQVDVGHSDNTLKNDNLETSDKKENAMPGTLPSFKGDRRLTAIYFINAWLAEDSEETVVIEKALPILLQALKSTEVHYYNERQELVRSCLDKDFAKKPLKVANFLSDHFQAAPESMIFFGDDLRYHQKRFGEFNYLVSPLKPTPKIKGTFPYLLLIKPSEWTPFDRQDRVLIHAISQIWSRTSAYVQNHHHLSSENKMPSQTSGEQPVMLGESDSIKKLRRRIEKSATNDAPVMIVGETGTGKEAAAWMIHEKSQRKNERFIKVNCSAIPDGLIESELFGHDKGAFTDARRDHLGKFEQADGGTLFLDEIGEMPLNVQSKVLRAIETSEFERVGSESSTRVDIRIITATHRNLKKMVGNGTFRQDLLFRLDVLRIKTPPLREHLDDIPELAQHFLKQCSEKNGVSFPLLTDRALELLAAHSWPGNVRELRNIMQRTALLAETPHIDDVFMRDIIEELEDENEW